jgi:mRNA deadenylase 3'-5' endonuclease subunit Ccr4
MGFLLCCYNVLADAYIRPEWYPAVAPSLLEAHARRANLIDYITGLGADVLCLQEVEPALHEGLMARLQPLGYEGAYARKGQGRPDGCSTIVLRRGLAVRSVQVLHYEDGPGGRRSGHVALLALLEQAGRRVLLANTHLRWMAPGTPPAAHTGCRQLVQLAAETARAGEGVERLLCGDFNLRPEDECLAVLRQAGLISLWDREPPRATCYANGRAKCVDHLWHSRGLEARLRPLPALDDRTPLPAPGQPSDHLALLADVAWVSSPTSASS